MTDYNYLQGALDFAVKYEATCVRIEVDNGILDMSPAEAWHDFHELSPGETFTLISIHFDPNN